METICYGIKPFKKDDLVRVVNDTFYDARYEVVKIRKNKAKILDVVHETYGGWYDFNELEIVPETREEIIDSYSKLHGE